MNSKHFVLAGLVLGAGLAHAQPNASKPEPAPPTAGKGDAKALMQSGLKLFEAKDYLGALSVFKSAYARFPSAKILLNIGTTLKELNRNADAANAYQMYLDSKDADPGRRTQVEQLITDLDRVVGKLTLTLTPPDTEVQVNNDDWVSGQRAKVIRVEPGQYTLSTRKEKFQPEAKQAQISAGETAGLAFVLTPIPDETKIVEVPVGGRGNNSDDDGGNHEDARIERSRFGMIALAQVDVPFDQAPRGGAMVLGGTADVTGQLQAHAGLIIGPTAETDVTLSGVYAGASFAFLPGNFRPLATAGFPIFFSNGARVGVRIAGGLEYQLNKHIALIAELGLEYMFNPEPMYISNLFVPAFGASGRL